MTMLGWDARGNRTELTADEQSAVRALLGWGRDSAYLAPAAPASRAVILATAARYLGARQEVP